MPSGDERVDVDAWSLSYARIGAAGRVVRRELNRGSSNERGPGEAAHSAVADALLTLPSPARCSSTDAARRGQWFSRSGRVAPGAGRGSTWSTRSAASMNDVDRRPGPGEPRAARIPGVLLVGGHDRQRPAPAGQLPGDGGIGDHWSLVPGVEGPPLRVQPPVAFGRMRRHRARRALPAAA